MAATARLKVDTRPADALFEALASADLSRFGVLRPAAASLPAATAGALLEGLRQNHERNRLQGHEEPV